jgi:hypothetical protein
VREEFEEREMRKSDERTYLIRNPWQAKLNSRKKEDTH